MRRWIRDNWPPALIIFCLVALAAMTIIDQTRRAPDPDVLRGGGATVRRVRDENRRTTCYVSDDGIFCLRDP